jgi:hypothetical protein
MKKEIIVKKVFLLVFCIACIGLMVSCASSSGAATETVPPASGTVDLSEARARATAAREKALSIKANVAAKADYDNAENGFNSADSVEAFLESERLFNNAFDTAKTMRDAAQNELEKARAEIKTAEDEAAAFDAEQAANEEGAM